MCNQRSPDAAQPAAHGSQPPGAPAQSLPASVKTQTEPSPGLTRFTLFSIANSGGAKTPLSHSFRGFAAIKSVAKAVAKPAGARIQRIRPESPGGRFRNVRRTHQQSQKMCCLPCFTATSIISVSPLPPSTTSFHAASGKTGLNCAGQFCPTLLCSTKWRACAALTLATPTLNAITSGCTMPKSSAA